MELNLKHAVIIGLGIGALEVFALLKFIQGIKKYRDEKRIAEEKIKAANDFNICIYNMPPKLSRDEAKKQISHIVDISHEALEKITDFENN